MTCISTTSNMILYMDNNCFLLASYSLKWIPFSVMLIFFVFLSCNGQALFVYPFPLVYVCKVWWTTINAKWRLMACVL